MEEPPQKVTKYEMESQYLEGEVMEEAQEEWLSEGVLTDDDYNPTQSQTTEADHSDQNTTNSQDKTMASESADDSQPMDTSNNMETQLDSSQQSDLMRDMSSVQQNNSMTDNNIEETLENFESSVNNNQSEELPEELSTFLTRKAVKTEEVAPSNADTKHNEEEDDGNDTDDLLRVLGDGEQKDKDHIKNVKQEASSDDDDDFVFQGKKVKTFQAAKNALMRGKAIKAEPEDDDVTDCSSDDAPLRTYVKKETKTSVVANKKPNVVQISSNVKPGKLTITPPTVRTTVTKRVVDVRLPNISAQITRKPPTAVKQYTNLNKRPAQGTSLLKANPTKMVENKKEKPKQMTAEKEFSMDDNKVKLKEESRGKREVRKPVAVQRLMKPEEMDEEVPTDADSDDDEESLYDELPTSGSEDEDWFTLDIRAERAGDYIPLLGDKAYQLLLEEKKRVTSKLNLLKQSLAALSQAGKTQAEKLRDATNTAAELDAMLKAV